MLEYLLSLKGLLLILLFTSLLVGFLVKKTGFKITFFNLAALLFCFFIYEAFILNSGEKDFYRLLNKKDSTYYKSSENNKLLGYGVKGDLDLLGIKTKGKDTIFTGNYTIRNGIRKTPNSNRKASKRVIFLGCSQTFGEGLEDNETLPYHFNEWAKQDYDVYNYAFGGYGTHQAKTITDSLLLKDSNFLDQADSTLVIYNFYNYHVLRTAGKVFWDSNGPWYDLVQDTVAYKGRFSDKPKPSLSKRLLKRFWFDARIYKTHFYRAYKYPQKEVDVTLALIKKMKTDLEQNGFRFLLIVNKRAYNDSLYFKELHDNGVEMICLECEVSDFGKNPKYSIPGDGHSTGLFNNRMGKILVEYVAEKDYF